MTKNNIPISNGCLDKGVALEKPAMFAFCLKPRGLEVPNKGSKHRSQKKISVSGHSNNVLYEQDGFHPYGEYFIHEMINILNKLCTSPYICLVCPQDEDSMGWHMVMKSLHSQGIIMIRWMIPHCPKSLRYSHPETLAAWDIIL